MATELAIFKLQSGHGIKDAGSKGAQVIEDTLAKLKEQPGFQRAYWGTEVENPDTFRLFVDWDSVDKHKEFMNKDIYKPFVDHFGNVAQLETGRVLHTHYSPAAQKALSQSSSPATEIILAYFPTDYSEADIKKFEQGAQTLFSTVVDNSDAYKAHASGWIEEEVTIPGTSDKAKAWSGLIGWTSVQAHLDFRTTQAFKDNSHHLRGAKDLKHIEVVHYHGTQVDK